MNPYKSDWRLAILGALIRRTSGSERNPERAARIRRRFAKVVAWALAVDADGVPADGSFWVRAATGRVWTVLYMERDNLVRIRLQGTPETELHWLPDFFERFIPEGCPSPLPKFVLPIIHQRACPACEGDVTFPHNHDGD